MIVLPEVPRRAPARATGLGAAVALGLAATVAGTLVPVVGAPVFAVVAGLLLSPLARRRSAALEPGLGLARGVLLQVSVVLLGARLSLGEVLSVGADSLPVMLGTLGVCLLAAWWVGRRLGVTRDLRTLIGVGTAICGVSAIAATTPAIRARSHDVAYAISTIFLFNVAAVLAFPPLGHALGLSPQEFGLFAGTAVNDTSSVVAAAGAYDQDTVGYAVVVKLARTLMIIPVVLVLTALTRRRADLPATSRARLAASLVPWFLVAFLVVAALNTGGLIPATAQAALQQVALLLVAVALAAVGLGTDVPALRRAGARPLLLGLVLWVVVGTTSLGLQHLLTR
ncbi:YeiH family protein [Micromonospora sp. R77]|uniref:YeiH family protein n=1 Tax=Micromonospora sp. R77 TaxID=2925836 RepID=UPI001F6134A2|nr:putative sulfate exporter family transporter [Micromonospora sp. R77]MCI4066821.1 YeiH family protein [Micromonospora sp. R77]